MSEMKISDLPPLEGCAAGLGVMALTAPGAVFQAWVLRHLWVWFVAPTFGVAVPGLATLVGLAVVVELLTFQSKHGSDGRSVTRVFAEIVAWLFVRPLVLLAVGWVAWKLS